MTRANRHRVFGYGVNRSPHNGCSLKQVPGNYPDCDLSIIQLVHRLFLAFSQLLGQIFRCWTEGSLGIRLCQRSGSTVKEPLRAARFFGVFENRLIFVL
jgi:hypothetical protein